MNSRVELKVGMTLVTSLCPEAQARKVSNASAEFSSAFVLLSFRFRFVYVSNDSESESDSEAGTPGRRFVESAAGAGTWIMVESPYWELFWWRRERISDSRSSSPARSIEIHILLLLTIHFIRYRFKICI
jgi:hypothetical protein